MNEAFESQFTPDGKINFKARIGMDKSKDPFKLENYEVETHDSVKFDGIPDLKSKAIDLDEEDYNDDW